MEQRRERLYRTDAVILRRHDVGEADRLLTLYTPEKGKLRAIAKSVRKPTSRKAKTRRPIKRPRPPSLTRTPSLK